MPKGRSEGVRFLEFIRTGDIGKVELFLDIAKAEFKTRQEAKAPGSKAPASTVAKKKGGRPKGSKNKTKAPEAPNPLANPTLAAPAA